MFYAILHLRGIWKCTIDKFCNLFFSFQKNPTKLWFKELVTEMPLTTLQPQLETIWKWSALPQVEILRPPWDGTWTTSKFARDILKKIRGHRETPLERGHRFRGWYFRSQNLMMVPPSAAKLNIQHSKNLYQLENFLLFTVSYVQNIILCLNIEYYSGFLLNFSFYAIAKECVMKIMLFKDQLYSFI